MALETSKVSIEDVKRELSLPADFFDAYSNDQEPLDERIKTRRTLRTAYVQRLVGSAGYTPTTEPKHTCVKFAEQLLVAADVLEEIVTNIAAVPTTVLHEDTDLGALQDQIERKRADAMMLLQPYIVVTDEGPGGILFSIGSTGIDETQRDDFSEIDFGLLEDKR